MGLSRPRIASIKKKFAQKITPELQEIVRLHDLNRWPEEAFVAAQEILDERAARKAQEPRVPEKKAPPPATEEHGGGLSAILEFAVGSVLGEFSGLLLGEDGTCPRPMSFGANLAWVAVEATDTMAVAVALGLQRQRQAFWGEGTAAAYNSRVFVTPPLGDWTLAASTALIPPEGVEAFVTPLLEELSRHFREAQYFCTHKRTGVHVWARARKGKVLRGYAWHGGRSSVIWNTGPQTKHEFDLGFRFTDGPTTPPTVKRADDPITADENCVMQLASLWSVDPSNLDEHFWEPVDGIVGEIPRK
jgi:hypothetical protein